jgi:lipid A 3-O-deacylase
MEIGLRGGCENSKSNLNENYAAAELYILNEFPRKMSLGEQAALSGRFDLGATYLKGSDDRGGMLAAGGDLVLGLWQGHLEFEIGFRPTWMFNHTYGEDNFGGGVQFTSHAGLAISLHNLVLNYRLQHTSNAGLYQDNPGLNLHMIGLGCRF